MNASLLPYLLLDEGSECLSCYVFIWYCYCGSLYSKLNKVGFTFNNHGCGACLYTIDRLIHISSLMEFIWDLKLEACLSTSEECSTSEVSLPNRKRNFFRGGRNVEEISRCIMVRQLAIALGVHKMLVYVWVPDFMQQTLLGNWGGALELVGPPIDPASTTPIPDPLTDAVLP
ncbi:hypothetical protein VNO77_43753 [Canavalia gladiata]|uniref:Uncharacterized protein n=1 Tax=Canavalia gladiata TaxID=3824 RepID=A0AAN9PPQ5_CANGL